MKVAENKQALTRFLTSYVIQHVSVIMQNHPERALYIAGGSANGEETIVLTHRGVEQATNLQSSQVEADTRIILHASHADKCFEISGLKGIISVKASDTDILVLCIHYFPHFAEYPRNP